MSDTDTDSDDEEEFESVFDKWRSQEPIVTWFTKGSLSPYAKFFLRYQRKHVDKFMVFGSAFSNHGFFVNKKDKRLYAFGKNLNGQCGINKKTLEAVQTPTLVVLDRMVKKVCCGDDFSFIHLVNKKVLSCGSNKYGQLGIGKKDKKDVFSPKKVVIRDNNNNVVEIEDVFTGAHHVVLITKDMDVYSCGYNKSGQLGVGHILNLIVPRKVDIDEKIFSATCGETVTFLISTKGTIYGTGSLFAMGVDKIGDIYRVPTKIPFLEKLYIVQISCGISHTIFLTKENKAYSCGEFSDGALGVRPNETKFGTRKEFILEPKLVSKLRKKSILSVKCGGFHTAFICKDSVFLTGSDKSYQLLGLGTEITAEKQRILIPRELSPTTKIFIDDYARSITASFLKVPNRFQTLLLKQSTLFITKNAFYGFGSMEFGELFEQSSFSLIEFTELLKAEVSRFQVREEVKEKKERFEKLLEEDYTDINILKKISHDVGEY